MKSGKMRAVVYRPNSLAGSWRPRSLVDDRGPRFPDEYSEFLVTEVESIDLPNQFEKIQSENIDGLFDHYLPETGDVVFLGCEENLTAYACGPMGWERVKFGKEWKSPG